jgi:2-polyprenyl-3-methyl-5-hydroxy-6-metoxy-1,4-benzoquinol methylase
MTDSAQPLGIAESISFWEQRHHQLATAYAGGDLSYDDFGNAALNALRVGRLLDLVGTFAEPGAPLRLLDAGCGTGWVTRSLAAFGHQVDGIDTSPTAVESSRAQARPDGRDQYHLSRLDEWAPPYLYDVVLSVDVLFHIMEDDVWAASVQNLGSLVRARGRLLLADHDLAETHVWGNYQMSRARSRYVELLEPAGFVHRRFVPYEFRDNQVGFHVFDRTG